MFARDKEDKADCNLGGANERDAGLSEKLLGGAPRRDEVKEEDEGFLASIKEEASGKKCIRPVGDIICCRRWSPAAAKNKVTMGLLFKIISKSQLTLVVGFQAGYYNVCLS